jgi:aminoglycoside phosphotransferase (APT) family kinase protein
VRTRAGAEITIDGEVVTKVHRPGTSAPALATRLQAAAALAGIVLAPLDVTPSPVDGRWLSRWPRVDTVAPDPQHLPWAEAGTLLARLHAAPARSRVAHGWPARLRRTVERLRVAGGAAAAVRRAAVGLPAQAWRPGSPDRPRTVVHGDFHLGQLGRRGEGSPWLLIDVDDMGVGDPGWDLARPAGLWAAGHLPDADWDAFLAAYRGAGGAALSGVPGDPWPVLEPFARAAVVAAAAAHLDDDLLVAACRRMT